MPVAFSNACTMGRHHSSCTVQYTTSSPCANAASGAASARAGTIARSNESTRMNVLLAFFCDGDADHGGELTAKRRVGRYQRIACTQPVACEKVVGESAGFADEHDARGAVPGIDVKLG